MSSNGASKTVVGKQTYDECCRPEFIYGGPFIKVEKPEPFMTTATPINVQLQGTFKRSFAYYSLKERLPIILTKIIDHASKKNYQEYVKYVAKLKSDLVTNKEYDLFTVDTEDARKWNTWIQDCENKRYFTNVWVFSECYVYRRLREGCELVKSLDKFDPFEDQKNQQFASSLEAMCVAADRVVTMLPESEKDKRKLDFVALLKLCLWANKCDLSLTVGEDVTLAGSSSIIDPFQLIIDLKDKVLVDDSGKIADSVVAKAETMRKAIEGNTTFKFQCSCHRLAAAFGVPLCKEPEGTDSNSPPPEPEEGEEAPKIPCPAKMVLPQTVMFDIVCDNAGYELFADLCLGQFLISQKIVDKVRFHVKNMPWFISDVTERDFKYVVDSCSKADYNRTLDSEAKPEGEEPSEPRSITADNLRRLGAEWTARMQEGSFIICDEHYWTWPHCYKDMKKYDHSLYRKLQYAVAVLFKGDLNYRKLLGEKNWNPVTGFETALQGFAPAPVIAVRTVKADLICGLPKGKADQLSKIDEKWMEKGDYGVIQYCAKAEALKVSDRPCSDYGDLCRGGPCPVHIDM